MAKSDLTAERLRELLHYDPETGVFTRLDGGGKQNIVSITRNAYLKGIRVGTFRYGPHRLAWLYVTGEMPHNHIDHINGDILDNRFVNLRDVTRCINMQNQRRAHRNNRTGLLGVFKTSGNKFSARIGIAKKQLYLGTFKTPEEAHAAYVSAKRLLHGGCTI